MRRHWGIRGRQRPGGFALIIVLWALVLIAFIVSEIVGTGRTEIKIAGNLVANAATEAAADGAAYQAVFMLLAPPPQRWALDGSPHRFNVGDCLVSVQLTDEAGRINPNLASPALLAALLQVSGTPQESAARLAAAIAEWVGIGVERTTDQRVAEYRSAGLDYAPPGERMESLSELRRVIGMTPAIFSAIQGHLSLYAPAQPEAAHADPVVAAAIAAITPGGATPQPAAALVTPDAVTARIEVTATGPGNSRAARTVIVRVVAGFGAYKVLAWRRSAIP